MRTIENTYKIFVENLRAETTQKTSA